MSTIQERYGPRPIAANGTEKIGTEGGGGAFGLGGFACEVSGTLTVNAYQQAGTLTTVLAIAVTAGVYLPLPIRLLGGSTVVLSGGAKGCLLVQ